MIHNYTKEHLYMLPLGGAGEIGMNSMLYHYQEKWLMVDLGLNFADENTPGIDILLPDTSFIEQNHHNFLGIILTHAHEDHLGAIPYIWNKLRCPIYATPFTSSLLKSKLEEFALHKKVPIHPIPLSQPFTLGPFSLEMIQITHSIPESHVLALRTEYGAVFHTGDWKLDPTPVIGQPTNNTKFSQIGQQENIIAMVCDSTNSLSPGTSGSERDVQVCFERLFQEITGRIAVTCFASNVERIQSIALAALRCHRSTSLVGRSLWRIQEAAQSNGYLKDIPPFLTEKQASTLKPDKIVLICAGSQGERRSSLSQIASDKHPWIKLETGDCVIFSARVIPGNEKAVYQLHNAFCDRGIKIITELDEDVHVSGHPAQQELFSMYHWIRPQVSIPVHGESRHQNAHAQLAKECNVPMTLIPSNGQIVQLAPGKPKKVGDIVLQNLAVDGTCLVPLNDPCFYERRKLKNTGVVMVTLTMNRKKGVLLSQTQVSAIGLLDKTYEHKIKDMLFHTINQLPVSQKENDAHLYDLSYSTVKKLCKAAYGKKPVIRVHLVRV